MLTTSNAEDSKRWEADKLEVLQRREQACCGNVAGSVTTLDVQSGVLAPFGAR